MNVGVFCSCSDLASPFLLAEMEDLGRALARDGHRIIYGGTNGGCMGALARGASEVGGEITGVIPRAPGVEFARAEGLSECHFVENLADRKTMMNASSDAVVIFPGGLGTLDEAFTVMAAKCAGDFPKPVIVYNFMGVWSPILEALDLLRAQHLIRTELDQIFVVLDKVDQVRGYLGELDQYASSVGLSGDEPAN